MPTLHRIVHLEKASLEDLNQTPVEKGPRSVLLIKCPLTSLMAEILGCAYVFKDTGVPVEHIDKLSLEQKLADFVFKVPSATDPDAIEEFRPELAWKFKADRDATAMVLSFRVHVSGAAQGHMLLDFANAFQDKEFTVTLQSVQGNLFESFEGEAVDMSGESGGLPYCSLCEDGIELDPRDPFLHVQGSQCPRAEYRKSIPIDRKKKAANDAS